MRKVFDGAADVHRECSELQNTMRKNENITASQLQREFKGKIKDKFMKTTQNLKTTTVRNQKFLIPSKDFLKEEFLQELAEVFADDRAPEKGGQPKTAQSLNELACREFLFQLLAGQTIKLAEKAAKAVYDKVIVHIFSQ